MACSINHICHQLFPSYLLLKQNSQSFIRRAQFLVISAWPVEFSCSPFPGGKIMNYIVCSDSFDISLISRTSPWQWPIPPSSELRENHNTITQIHNWKTRKLEFLDFQVPTPCPDSPDSFSWLLTPSPDSDSKPSSRVQGRT